MTPCFLTSFASVPARTKPKRIIPKSVLGTLVAGDTLPEQSPSSICTNILDPGADGGIRDALGALEWAKIERRI